MRSTALLVLAGVAAFAAALRFETAVHPGEISDPRFVRAFEDARDQLPALGSLRIHSEADDVGMRLRRIRRSERKGEVVRISAADPLNLVGIITPGPRVPAVRHNQVVYRDGLPVHEGEETTADFAG